MKGDPGGTMCLSMGTCALPGIPDVAVMVTDPDGDPVPNASGSDGAVMLQPGDYSAFCTTDDQCRSKYCTNDICCNAPGWSQRA